MTTVAGLDPSLTATAIAIESRVQLLRTPYTGPERMIEIRNRVLTHTLYADLVVIEAPSFASATRSAKEIGGIWWVLRVALHEDDTDVLEVPPATLKKYATGKGNASKGEMLAAAIRRLDYDGADDNEADALWLEQIGLCLAGDEHVVMPSANRAALNVLAALGETG